MPEHDERKSSPNSYELDADIEERLAERDHAARCEVLRYVRLTRTRILSLYLRLAARSLLERVAALVRRFSSGRPTTRQLTLPVRR